MRRNIITIALLAIAFALGAGAGVLGFLWATGGTEAESVPVEQLVPTLSLDTPTPGPLPAIATDVSLLRTQVDALSSEINALSTQLAAGAAPAATLPPDQAEGAAATAEPTAEAAAVSDRVRFRIDGDQSTVSFTIVETLAGLENTVVGTTRRVAGEMIIDFGSPQQSQVGQLAINARTFRTDDSFRDDSIRGHILEAETYEFITFTPTELRGLPETSPAVGETIQFEIVGDLSVHGVTQTKVFEAEVTLVDEDTLAGTATTEATYTEFNITIRTPPLVSEVKDALTLSIEFVATRAEA